MASLYPEHKKHADKYGIKGVGQPDLDHPQQKEWKRMNQRKGDKEERERDGEMEGQRDRKVRLVAKK